LVDREVDAVVAEDASGWFGVRPGRADLVAALPPGLLTFRHRRSERFVAHAGGLLDLRRDECRVMVGRAWIADELERLADALVALESTRRARGLARREMLSDLEREALQRLVQEART
jgi:F-type H+-transporting ATPase subunit epsilon